MAFISQDNSILHCSLANNRSTVYEELDIFITMTLAKVSIDTHSIKPNEAHHLYPLVHQTSQALSCPPFGFRPHPQYDWGHSTEDNYRSEERKFFGKFQKIRQRLDYEYHSNYSRGRQRLQDSIIDYLLSSTGRERNTPSTPWIIFTAGVMGAGKTHTIKHLHANGKFPLESFVSVDPDEIRRLLPEFHDYVKKCPEKAGRFTRKEAGMITEILTKAALESGKNVSVDGSLRDAIWYRNYFVSLRNTYPAIKLGIIHVTAPMEAILQRVEVCTVLNLLWFEVIFWEEAADLVFFSV